jgi:hypothetical protein
MSANDQVTPADKKLFKDLTQRVVKSFTPDGKGVKISDAKLAELQQYFSAFTAPRPRELAIATLVKMAYALDTKVGSRDASKKLLAVASKLVPPKA